jgi:signal transduction histidine kinase
MRFTIDRRISIVVIVFAALLLIFLNLSQWYLHAQMERFLEARISREIRAVAESTAERIDPFVVEEVAADEYLLADYAQLVSTLDNIRRANELIGIGLFDIDGGDLLGLHSDSSDAGFEILNLTEFTSAAAGIAASTAISRSDSLYLLSAFAPVYDYDDSVIAVVHAEAGYAVFKTLEDFKRNIVLMNIGSILFMLLFAALFYLVNRKLLMAQQALLRASAISSMGQMAATIAHEIRNPLSIIKNSSERIRKKYPENADDPAFEFISDEVDRLNSVVAGYLDFAHPVQRKREEIDLEALINTVIEQTRTDFTAAGIQIAVSCSDADGLPPAIADRFAVRQALLNVMLNAKDAQPNGGRIDITIKPDRWKGKDGVRVDLADRGPGIPPGSRSKVFDPFFTTREKGSGLGLYIAKKVADAHGGELSLKSDIGVGTVVSLFLPGKGSEAWRRY